MYKDRVSISRQIPCTDEEGADDYEVQKIYTDIPCKLSQYKEAPQGDRTDRNYNIVTDLRLCLAPEYDVLPNDILDITHAGKIIQVNAVECFKYPTHQEISVHGEDDA